MSICTRPESPYLYMRFTFKGKAYFESTGVLNAAGTKDEKKNNGLAAKCEKDRRETLRLEYTQSEARRAVLGITKAQETAMKVTQTAGRNEPTWREFIKPPRNGEAGGIWWKEDGDSRYPESSKKRFHMRRMYIDKAVALTQTFPVKREHPEFSLAPLKLTEIPKAMRVYTNYRERQGRSGVTINGEVKAILMFLRSARRLGFPVVIPEGEDVTSLHREENVHERVLSAEEERIYLEATAGNDDLQLFCKIAIDTSFEPGPLSMARWEDVHFEDAEFKLGYIQDNCTKQSTRNRPLAMTPIIRTALLERWTKVGQPTNGWLFPADRNGATKPSPLSTFQNAHTRLWGMKYGGAARIGSPLLIPGTTTPVIEYFRLYDLRHTALTRAVINGATVFQLQQMAGWKTLKAAIKMADRYIHLSKSLRAETGLLMSKRSGV